MKNFRFAFYVSEKACITRFGAQVAAGAKVHGDSVELIHQNDYKPGFLGEFDGGANLGLARACSTLMSSHLNAGKHFLFFDKGYLRQRGYSYWRVSVDAWQPLAYFQRFMRSSDRLKDTGLRLKNRRKVDPEHHILFAGACQNYNNFCGLGNINEYNHSVLKKLRASTDRKIIYRPNPSWFLKHHDEFRKVKGIKNIELSTPDTPYDKTLENCYLVVAHGSSASVGALAQGIPVMTLGGGICRPIGLTEDGWSDIEALYWPKEASREQFFADLAYCQWTDEEYRNGRAWAEIRLTLQSLEKPATITPDEVIGQYQIMHKHPNYFRGLTTLKYKDDIWDWIVNTDSNTILDYGSGKGEQYLPPHDLQSKWGVSVRCYDPGVPKFWSMPSGKFDGVICCDVMEHVPEEDVQHILRDVIGLADKFVFFSIASSPATKQLPTGHNCHLTTKGRDWWCEQVGIARQAVRAPGHVRIAVTMSGEDHD